jgi:hypothetical protein
LKAIDATKEYHSNKQSPTVKCLNYDSCHAQGNDNWYMKYAVFQLKTIAVQEEESYQRDFLILDMLLFHVKQRICDARRNIMLLSSIQVNLIEHL